NGVELPEEVRGWMLLKKLALEHTSESMVLTASQGSVKYSDIVAAVRNVFPSGKSFKTAKTKDIFITEDNE
ncbi:CCHC-type domain-containing protein, partial [Durusdinium trenchii]